MLTENQIIEALKLIKKHTDLDVSAINEFDEETKQITQHIRVKITVSSYEWFDKTYSLPKNFNSTQCPEEEKD